MSSLSTRQLVITHIHQACSQGARLHQACDISGISLNTGYRWQSCGEVVEDGRPTALRKEPANKLSQQERQPILELCNSERFERLPPSQIIPILADEECYLASESSFYRVLKEAGQNRRRGRAALPKNIKKPPSYTATAPNPVWSWDLTWLPGPVQGHFYKLYLIEDIFSRFPVGYEVHEQESNTLY